MRQILGQTGKVVVARMPRPEVTPGSALIRVQYSFVSVGTEITAIAPPGGVSADALEKTEAYASLAWTYLGKAIRDPRKAAERLSSIARSHLERLNAERTKPSSKEIKPTPVHGVRWQKQAAATFKSEGSSLAFVSDDSPAHYQAMSSPVTLAKEYVLRISLKGRIVGGPISLGLLDETRSRWIASTTLGEGPIDDAIVMDVQGATEGTLVFSNANAGRPVNVDLGSIDIDSVPTDADRLPATELAQQGWNMGYSAAGVVVAVGDGVSGIKPGDRVACGGTGLANHADFVVVPRNLICRIPDGCSMQAAAAVCIGSIALQGVRRASPQLGEWVCVLGLGLIGLIAAQMLRANGCRVIAYEPVAGRAARAATLGIEHCAVEANAFKTLVRDLTGGQGADATLICAATKSDDPVNLSMAVTRPKGRVVIVGDVGLNVDRADFYRKEIDLLMSTSYGPGRYDRAYEEEGRDYPYPYVRWTENRNMRCFLDLVGGGQIDMDALIDLVVPVSDAPKAYEMLLKKGAEKPLAVLIHYPEEPQRTALEFDSPRIALRGHGREPVGAIRCALVGAGGFGAATLAPLLNRQKDLFHLHAVVSRDSARGGNVARQYRVKTQASDLSAVLTDPELDMLILATRHHEHAAQVVASLKAGKHVFVEKPLAIAWDQLDRVVETYGNLKERPVLMVGFNRRFSPALRAAAAALAKRTTPLVVHYRLNAGYIPLDNWVQGREGGGRNIGEACHMYDCFRYLAGAPVSSVSATAIDPGAGPYLRNDNFCATVGYEDGSVGNLVYTASGPKTGMPKERIEIFCAGEAYVIDDFKSLIRTSDGKVLWEGEMADKGHAEEFRQTGNAVRDGTEAPIPFAEIVETTAVSLQVEDLLDRGRG